MPQSHNPDNTGRSVYIREAKNRLENPGLENLIGGLPGQHTFQVCRVLRALIDHAVEDEGKFAIAKQVWEISKSAPDLEAVGKGLVDLADSWIQHFFVALLTLATAITTWSSEAQTPTLDDTAGLIESAFRGDQHAFSRLLQRREGNRCCITGAINIKDPCTIPTSVEEADLEVTHILPFALSRFNDRYNAAVTWDMFRTWASVDIEKWVRDHINDPGNAILLASHFHKHFSAFRVWFEKDAAPNTYKVNVNPRYVGLTQRYHDNLVTFTDHSGSGIQLPLPEALAIHASFAKVYHASGAAAFFQNVLKDQEQIKVLAVDGSTDITVALSSLVLKGRRKAVAH